MPDKVLCLCCKKGLNGGGFRSYVGLCALSIANDEFCDDSPRLKSEASRSSPTERTRHGSFTKAPSEPTVGSISVGGVSALQKTLRHRLVHQTLSTLALLPKGTIYLGTCKHYSVICVLEVVYHGCQYTNIHDTGEECEHSFI